MLQARHSIVNPSKVQWLSALIYFSVSEMKMRISRRRKSGRLDENSRIWGGLSLLYHKTEILGSKLIIHILHAYHCIHIYFQLLKCISTLFLKHWNNYITISFPCKDYKLMVYWHDPIRCTFFLNFCRCINKT